MRGLAAALVVGVGGLSLQQGALAQGVEGEGGRGNAPGLSIQPRVSVTEAWTDNLMPANAQGQLAAKDAALITTLSPGVSIVSRSGRVRGSLDYALNGIAYIKSEQHARLQNSLNAVGSVDLVEGAVIVDARAAIAQQSASAFGLQTADTTLTNPNQREVWSASVTPSWRGVLAGVVTFDLQATESLTRVRNSTLGDGHSDQGSLRLSAARPGLIAPWLMLSSQRSGFSVNAMPSRLSSAMLGAQYRADVDWRLNLSAGRERSNYLASNAANGASYALSTDWTPNPRTQLAADWQHHSFGDSHSLSFSHRLARTSWQFSDSRSINLGNTAGGGARTNYELFFQQFAGLEPDPVKRDQMVRSYLQSLGLSPDAPYNSGFLAAGPSRLHNQQLSLAMRSVRTALTVTLARTQTRRVGTSAAQGDLAQSGQVDQRSANVNLAHQLTPTTSVNLGAAMQRTRGDLGAQANSLKSLTAGWSARLGQRLSIQLGLRRSEVTGMLAYTENAGTATLTQQF